MHRGEVLRIEYFAKEKTTMANNAGNYIIGGNDEHGINPPTIGKRTPVMPYINRSIYENEFNYAAKNNFLIACLRTGFNIFDVKPERTDTSINTRIARVNAQRLAALVTFAYNAAGNELVFSDANGIEVYYSPNNSLAARSQHLANDVYQRLLQGTGQNGRGVKPLDVGMLTGVRCPATLIETGFMTNFAEAKLMLDPDFQKEVGNEACQGVCDFLDVPYIGGLTTTQGLPTIRVGNRGRAVQCMQYYLIQNGFNPGTPDGVFGQNTLRAVQAFQAQNGLTVDGIVGQNTWRRLLVLDPSSVTLRRGSTGSYVRYLQRKLTAKLYPVGTIDNIFGAQTERAVREFQQENGLVVDGIVGRNTWNKLIPIGGGRPYPYN